MAKKKTESTTHTLESLNERIDALENYLKAGEFEASMLTIRGDGGTVRTQITDQGLYLADAEGRLRLAVVTDANGAPMIDLLNDDMMPCLSMTVLETGAPSMVISGGYNKGRIHLRLTLAGTPLLFLADAKGNERLALGLDAEGRPSLNLLDENKAVRFDLVTETDGTPGLVLLDAQGRNRAALVLAHDGTPQIRLDDPAGSPFFIAP